MIPHHPEIEDDEFMGNLLDDHEGQSAERTSVDVLEVRGDDIRMSHSWIICELDL